ncbi:T9SS type A sorting domain-containing protein [uncultured Lacinutrix sp.]|uniref:T9SS type A sorting domain-containing protein n=1 Tax=uncultured Lacinutrix sp. TaxID=574032 RepID=UPI002612DDF7|nr:T9SS type A sorting domain-containing protein [uncultured Lacinutrix sp.]
MKQIKSLLIALFFSFGFVYGQTTLAAGDIAITGVNSDNPDQFTFVLLTDVLNTTQIKFTDNGWQTSGSFRTGEGIIIWTATSDLTCGTEITITDNSPYSASIGTVTDSNLFSFDLNGDQILAYQGLETSPTFLYAIFFGGTNGWTNATTPLTSAVPNGLTDTINALYIGDFENGNYNCSTVIDTPLILAAVSNATNWTVNNTRITNLGGCSYNCLLCPSTVTWNGTWTPSIPDTNSEVIIDADYDTATIGLGSFSSCSLTVNSGFTLTINNNHTIEVENDVTNNGTIAIETNGSFVQNNDNGIFTNLSGASSTVTKITAPAEDWLEYTFWSSPVVGETAGNALSPAAASRRFSFQAENFRDSAAEINNDNILVNGFYDDEDDNGNVWSLTGSSDVLLPGIGYAATLSFTSFTGPGSQIAHTFSGEFNNGIIPVTIYRNDTEANDKNWNFIGNPYPSAISVADFLSENAYNATTNPTGTIEGILYLWSHQNAPASNNNGNSQNNFSQSDYAMVNGTGGTAGGDNNGDGIVNALDEPNPYIPSGQGFFVEYHNMGSSTGSSTNGDGDTITEGIVTFNNSMRSTGNNNQFFRTSNSTNETNKLWIYLSSDTGVSSQILVGYLDGATNLNDGAFYDATRNKSIGNNTFLFSTIENSDYNYAIQGKAPESLTLNEVIPLGLYTTITNPVIYSISISHFEGDFFNSNTIYLRDNYNNVIHNLSDSNYNFTSNSGDFRDRFEIVFNANSLNVDGFEISANNVSIIELQNNNVKFTVTNSETIQNVKIFDILGRELYQFKGNSSKETYNLSGIKSTPYIAQILLSNGNIIVKKVIKR